MGTQQRHGNAGSQLMIISNETAKGYKFMQPLAVNKNMCWVRSQ